MARIQIITIIINVLFLSYIAWLIVKGKLREEYSIVWLICTGILTLFSFWREGLDVVANLFGVYVPANLVFTVLIFVILIYLLHLSIVNSKLQRNLTKLTQELTLLKEAMEKEKADTENK